MEHTRFAREAVMADSPEHIAAIEQTWRQRTFDTRWIKSAAARKHPLPEADILPAIRRAVAAGEAVRLSVRLTADRQPVLAEPRQITCRNGRKVYVAAEELADLRNNSPLPTLEEALALVDGNVPLILELKSVAGSEQTLAYVVSRQIEGYRGKLALQSFNPKPLRWSKRILPDVPAGLVLSLFAPRHGETEGMGLVESAKAKLGFPGFKPDYYAIDLGFCRCPVFSHFS